MAARHRVTRFAWLAAASTVLVAQPVFAADSGVKDGAACTSAGKVVNVKTPTSMTDFICKQEGSRKVWRVLKVAGGGGSSGSSNGGKSGSKSGSSGSGSSSSRKPPSGYPFQGVGIDFTTDPWQWTDAKELGPFQPIKMFYRDYQGMKEQSLTMMMLKPGTKVFSPVTGKVIENLSQPESCDSELYIMYDEPNNGFISFDHLTPSKSFKKGDVIKTGDLIGTLPTWDCGGGSGKTKWAGVEFNLVHPDTNTVYCPLPFVVPAKATAINAEFRKVMERWNGEVGSIPTAYSAKDIERGPCDVASGPIYKNKP